MKALRTKLDKLRSHKSVAGGLDSEAHGEEHAGTPLRTPSTSPAQAYTGGSQEQRFVSLPLEHADPIPISAAETDTGVTPLKAGYTRGLRIITSPAQAALDIIFIHGLIGDSLRTWQHQPSGIHWPTDLLPKEIPEARILTFGYDADVTKLFGGPVGQSTLRNHAATLVSEYSAIRQQDTLKITNRDPSSFNQSGRKGVIVVAHSLGGLITKKALCVSDESPVDSEKVLSLDTIGICFLGTPHRGSDMADIASIASKVLQSMGKRVNSRILELLRPDSEVLDEVRAAFGNWLRRNHKRTSVVSFFEELELPRIGMVVTQSSALIDGYPQLSIPSNHRDMTKFSSVRDIGFMRIVDQIRITILQKQKNEKPPDTTPQLLPGYEDFLEALSYLDMSRRYGGILAPADDTCGWLVDHSVYKEWCISGDSIMWILGHPGTGKSTLMKYAVQKSTQTQSVYRNSSITLSFFFYNLGSELQKSVEGMLRAVLFQLLQALPSITGGLTNISRTFIQNSTGNQSMGMSKKSIWDSTNLMETLEESIALALEQTDIWLFIDALDECRRTEKDTADDTEEIRQLIKDLRRILRKFASYPHKLRVCCSCRHYPHIASLNNGYKVLVENENRQDIKEYITQELESEVLPDHRDLLESLVETILSKAMGSFQWVRLVTQKTISMYSAGKNASKIQECVDDIPKHLSDLYGSILSSIAEDDRPQSRRLFGWACLSSKPLSLPELRLVMNINPHKYTRSFKDLESLPEFIENDFQMERIVQSLSGGLAELSEINHEGSTSHHTSYCSPSDEIERSVGPNTVSGALPDINSGWVRGTETTCYLFLIHQSVKDYMMTEGFQVLNGGSIPEDTVSAGLYRDMSITYAIAFAMQLYTINEQQLLSHYGRESQEYSDKTLFSIIKWLQTHSTNELEKFFTKMDDPRYTRTSPIEHDASMLLQHMSSVYVEEHGNREKAIIMICNFLAWNKALHIPGINLNLDDIFLYASEAKRRGLSDIETQLISSISNSEMQDPLMRLVAITNAYKYDLPEILSHVFTFTGEVDNYVRQVVLVAAVEEGSYDVSTLLLDGSKIPPKEPFEDQDALLVASANGHTDIVKLLLAHGANIHQTDDEMKTPLYRAARNGYEQICRALLDKGADIDARNEDGVTPFMAAARNGHQAVCDILIGYSPDIDAADNNGITVITYAARGGNMHIVSALMCGMPNWPKTVSLSESTILQSGLEALKKDDVEFCKLAIRCKGIEFLSSAGINAASAASFGASSCLRLFLDSQQDINRTTYKKYNPLHWAIKTLNEKLVNVLLNQHDVDINYPCEGYTALCGLATWPRMGRERAVAIAKMLLKQRCLDPNLKSHGFSALHLAINHHRRFRYSTTITDIIKSPIYDEPSEFVKLLLGHPRIDVNIKTPFGLTSLGATALCGCSSIARQILEHKSVQPDLKDSFGFTPLHIVAKSYTHSAFTPQYENVTSLMMKARVMDTLLERTDIDINSRDNGGKTPLDQALKIIQEIEATCLNSNENDGDNTDEGYQEDEEKSGTGDEDRCLDAGSHNGSHKIFISNCRQRIEICRSIVGRLRDHGAMCGDCVEFGNVAYEATPSTPALIAETIDTTKATEAVESPIRPKSRGRYMPASGPRQELRKMRKTQVKV